MKADATKSGGTNQDVQRRSHVATFAKVSDGRKQPIRGLWIRGERYYARLKVENPITGIKKTRRVPLIDKKGKPVQTVAQAVAELKQLRTQRSDNTLPTLTRTPKFDDYAARYLDFVGSGHGAKKPGTVEKEKAILKRWSSFLGSLRLDQIKRVHVNRFIESRLKENVSPRTINLDVIGLRVVFKRALLLVLPRCVAQLLDPDLKVQFPLPGRCSTFRPPPSALFNRRSHLDIAPTKSSSP